MSRGAVLAAFVGAALVAAGAGAGRIGVATATVATYPSAVTIPATGKLPSGGGRAITLNEPVGGDDEAGPELALSVTHAAANPGDPAMLDNAICNQRAFAEAGAARSRQTTPAKRNEDRATAGRVAVDRPIGERGRCRLWR